MYKYIQRIKNSKAAQFAMHHKRLTFYTALALLLCLLVMTIVSECNHKRQETIHREILLEDTPIEIEDVRPTGEIYVCSAIMEDYTTLQKTERHLGIIPEKHSCVQMLRQKCSYKIDLDKIVYAKDTLNRVFVMLPEIEYTASTQNSPFMSDDEEYWIEALPNTNGFKKKVASQIRKRFDTPDNRDKARKYAETAVAGLLYRLGYEAQFVSQINKQKE